MMMKVFFVVLRTKTPKKYTTTTTDLDVTGHKEVESLDGIEAIPPCVQQPEPKFKTITKY